MATQSVTYRVNNWLSCAGCLPADVIICLGPEIITSPVCPEQETLEPFIYHTIDATITAVSHVSGGSCLNTQYYEYTLEYDSDSISTPLLVTADIDGVICRGCLTNYIDQQDGNEIFVRDNEDGTFSIISQHGCEYPFISGGELSDLVVEDTDSIDLTLSGVSPKVLTADLIVDPNPLNQLTVGPAGVFVSPQWRLLGNAGTVLGTNFLGTTDNVALDFRVNNVRARRTIPTAAGAAANILDGYSGNTMGVLVVGSTIAGGGAVTAVNSIATGNYNFIGAGTDNTINVSAFGAQNGCFIGAGLSNQIVDGKSSSIVGGENNAIAGAYSFIGGGIGNNCSIASATIGEMFIGGGRTNQILGRFGSIVGGQDNEIAIDTLYCFIGGGQDNQIILGSNYSNIVGGQENIIQNASIYATIGGGLGNIILGTCIHSVIAGGNLNLLTTTSRYSAIGGGRSNSITQGEYCFIGGGQSNYIDEAANYGVIGGGTLNHIGTIDFSGVLSGSNNSTVANAVIDGYSVVCGGLTNVLETCSYSFIGGGKGCEAHEAAYVTLGGGEENEIGVSSNYSAILSGRDNTIGASNLFAIIVGGDDSTIQTGCSHSIIVGGNFNLIAGTCTLSFIGGGNFNSIQGNSDNSVVCGGNQNRINGTSGHSVIGGGAGNTIDNASITSAICGGAGNQIIGSSERGFIGGGADIRIEDSDYSTISGGATNSIEDSSHSFIGSGQNNIIQNGAVCSCILGGEGNTISSEPYTSILGGAGLILGMRSVGFNSPRGLTPPYSTFANQVNLDTQSDIAYFGDVDIWVGNVRGTASKVIFWEPGTTLDYTGRMFSSFRATAQTANYEYLWPNDNPVAGQALRVQAVAGTLVTLEWDT